MHFQQNATNYHKIITTKMHLITFNFKRQLNSTNIFNATIDVRTVWTTWKFAVECSTVLMLQYIILDIPLILCLRFNVN